MWGSASIESAFCVEVDFFERPNVFLHSWVRSLTESNLVSSPSGNSTLKEYCKRFFALPHGAVPALTLARSAMTAQYMHAGAYPGFKLGGGGPHIPNCHYDVIWRQCDVISIYGFRAKESWSIEGKRKAYTTLIEAGFCFWKCASPYMERLHQEAQWMILIWIETKRRLREARKLIFLTA